MIPPTYAFEKLDDVYRNRVDNACPWHILRCTLGKNEIAFLLRTLRELREREAGKT